MLLFLWESDPRGFFTMLATPAQKGTPGTSPNEFCFASCEVWCKETKFLPAVFFTFQHPTHFMELFSNTDFQIPSQNSHPHQIATNGSSHPTSLPGGVKLLIFGIFLARKPTTTLEMEKGREVHQLRPTPTSIGPHQSVTA